MMATNGSDRGPTKRTESVRSAVDGRPLRTTASRLLSRRYDIPS
jgi:hypothetical protein